MTGKVIKKDKVVLTAKEIRVLKLLCKEKTGVEIGKLLKIGTSTVDYHKTNLFKKTKAKSVVGLVKYAIRNGIYTL